MGGARARATQTIAFAVLAAVLAAAFAAPLTPDATAAAKKCKDGVVNGRHVCLNVGQKCQKAYQDDYVAAGFSCRGNKLRKASIKELRGDEPILVSDNGQISLRTAMAVFDTGIADLPGFKPRPGEIGDVGDATAAIGVLQANLAKLSAKQRAA